MDVRIITISREFGSGGRTIGKKLAERLGVPYYDKELVNEVALECGFNDVKLFRKYFKDEFGRLPSDYHK